MSKKKSRKTSYEAGRVNREEAMMILKKGESFGEALVEVMSEFAIDWKGMGIATIGLAKALAALRSVAKELGVDVDKLYESELAYFEELYAGYVDSLVK